jgi:hypothetical protein
LTIQPLKKVVHHQHSDHQEHQRFYPLRRVQKHRTNGHRSFELAIHLLAIALLLELGKQRIRAASIFGNRAHDHRVTIVFFIFLYSLLVEREFEAMWSAGESRS